MSAAARLAPLAAFAAARPAQRQRLARLGFSLAAALSVAAVVLEANRHLSSDMFFLIACGEYILRHGVGSTTTEVFGTLNDGRVWLNQQWLTEVVFALLHRAGGMRLLEFVYAIVVGLAALPLVHGCRRRPWPVVAAALVLAIPALIAVLDPRAAGFSLLLFSLLVVLVDGGGRRRVWLIPLVFLVWANMHAACAAGLMFLALVAVGRIADIARGVRHGRIWRLAVFGVAVPMVFATPLGAGIIRYSATLASDPLLPRVAFEWQPTLQHPLVACYLVLLTAFGSAWWWVDARRGARPRLEPLIVLCGFALFALTADRQVIWMVPVLFFVLRSVGPEGSEAPYGRLSIAVGAAALAVLGGWWLTQPTPAEPGIMTRSADALAGIAAQGPDATWSPGRVAGSTGTGSYLLYRSTERHGAAPTVDGRLENYRPAEIEDTYALMRGEPAGLRHLDEWCVTAVITRDASGIAVLERRGFTLRQGGAGSGALLTRRLPPRLRCRAAATP